MHVRLVTGEPSPSYHDATAPGAGTQRSTHGQSTETRFDSSTRTRANNGFGNFCTGFGAGGLAGYLFGRR